MSQPRMVFEYLGAISAKSGKINLSADVITAYPTANAMKMKTPKVSVSINGSDMFLTSFDDESYISTGKSFIFDTDCTIAIGRYVPVP